MIEALFWDKDSGSRSAMFIYIVYAERPSQRSKKPGTSWSVHPVDFGTRQLVKQLMTSLNQPMETLETVVQNIVSSISKQDSVNHTMHMFKIIQIIIIARIIRWYMQQQA